MHRHVGAILLPFLLLACAGEGDTTSSAPPTSPSASRSAGASSVPAVPAAEIAAVELQEREHFDGLSYQPPARWVSDKPSSSMRLAQYRLPAAPGDSEDAECALFVFPGTGGTVDANLGRWYGQFSQPDGSSTEARAQVESFMAGDLPVTIVEVTGTYSGGMSGTGPHPGYALAAGIIESDSPWFLKCTGPAATIASAAAELRAVLHSVER